MPRVSGPLFSATARGTFANIVTFATRRGQPIVTLKPVPTQRYTLEQANAKQVIEVGGAMIRRIFRGQVGKADGETMTPLEYLEGVKVNPNTWASHLNQATFPSGTTTLTADIAAYAALEDAQKTAWMTWNSAFSVPFVDIGPRQGGTRTVTGVEAAFVFARGMARVGYIDELPDETPPTWDNTLKGDKASDIIAKKKGPRRGEARA